MARPPWSPSKSHRRRRDCYSPAVFYGFSNQLFRTLLSILLSRSFNASSIVSSSVNCVALSSVASVSSVASASSLYHSQSDISSVPKSSLSVFLIILITKSSFPCPTAPIFSTISTVSGSMPYFSKHSFSISALRFSIFCAPPQPYLHCRLFHSPVLTAFSPTRKASYPAFPRAFYPLLPL